MDQAEAFLMSMNHPAYAVITPVRDEGRYLKSTIDSMVEQQLTPVVWIIVDDGSTDNSAAIIREYAAFHPWIILKQTERNSPRLTGSAEIQAFNFGLTFLQEVDFDFIVKLDADLSFDSGYFADLISRFATNPKLGIASGVYAEKTGEEWLPVRMPDYHAAGASKVIRASCFRQMGGFIPFRGWDTVDEIKAMYLGWETTHFPDLIFRHLKNEGTGMGWLGTTIMHGEIYYRTTGGGYVFFALKVASRMVSGNPILLNGIALLYGYIKTWVTRKPLLVSRAEANHYRKLLNRRLRPAWLSGNTLTPVKSL